MTRVSRTMERQAREIEALKAENERLREDDAQVFIEELSVHGGNIEARLQSPMAEIIGEWIRETIKAGGGENFLTVHASFGGEDPVYITFGRLNGKTVDEKYHQAASENERLREALELSEDDRMNITELAYISLRRSTSLPKGQMLTEWDSIESHLIESTCRYIKSALQEPDNG